MKEKSYSYWREMSVPLVGARHSFLLCLAVLIWTLVYTLVSLYLIPKFSLPEALNWPVAALVALVPVVFAKQLWGQGYIQELRARVALGSTPLRSFVVLLALILVALGLTVYQFFVAQAAESLIKFFGYTSQSVAESTQGKVSISYLLYASLFGPIVEELIFRGVLLPALRPWGRWAAIILSALSFGLMHHDIQQAISAATLGVLLGYVALRWGLIYSMILHVVGNSWINIGGLLEKGSILADLYFIGQLIAALATLFIGVYVLIKLVRNSCSLKKKQALYAEAAQEELDSRSAGLTSQESLGDALGASEIPEVHVGFNGTSQFHVTQAWALIPLFIMFAFDLYCCLRFSLQPLVS